MALMDNETAGEIRKILDALPGEVKLVFFKENLTCQTCPQVEELLKELSALSGKIKLEIYNKYVDEAKAAEYSPAQVPALFVEGPKSGKRAVFYGLPAGYEFVSLMEAIKGSAAEAVDLQPETLEKLKEVKNKVNIKVFVTTTCPYCPAAVVMAHKFAMASENITGEMIESNEFPKLSQKYEVSGVPKIVVNDKVHLTGAQPESAFLSAVIDSQREIPNL